MELLSDTGLIENRIKNVESLLEAINENHEAEHMEEDLFGNGSNNREPGIFTRLENFRDEITNEKEILVSVHIVDTITQIDFSNRKDQIQFLNYYSEIRPYLNQVDANHGDSCYETLILRELQKPEDFENLLKKIFSLKPKIEEMINSKKICKEEQIKRCEAHIENLDKILEAQTRRNKIHSLGEKTKNFKIIIQKNSIPKTPEINVDNTPGPDILKMKELGNKMQNFKSQLQAITNTDDDKIQTKKENEEKGQSFNN